jgi:hypothetical protein
VRSQLRRATGIVVDGRKFQDGRQPTGRGRSRRLAGEARGFRLRRFGGEAPQQRPNLGKRRIVELLAGVDDFLHERQFEAVVTFGGLSFDRGQRGAKGEQDAGLQASPAGERGKAFPLRLEDKGGDARQRQARQFRQSMRE